MLKPRILIVEDDVPICDLLEFVFRSRGYEVTSVVTGEEALSVLEKSPSSFQIILCDIILPGIDGIDVFKKARESHPNIPVLFVTSQETRREDAVQLGADGFFLKPFDYEALAKRVRACTPASVS